MTSDQEERIPAIPDWEDLGLYEQEDRESILQEAQRLTHGDRARDYGHPYHDYTKVVEAFNALTGKDLTPAEGAVFMCCVKLARECHRPKRDNRVDLAGYAHVLDRIQEYEGPQRKAA